MKRSDIRIRKAQACDAEKLIHVHFDAVHGISEDVYSRALLFSWSPTPCPSRYEWMRDLINSSSHLALVAGSAFEACAFSICSLNDGFIRALYVDPKFTGQSMGKHLLVYSETRLMQAGFSIFKLNASNNSLDFYRSMGYCVNAQTRQSLEDGAELNCHEMQKVAASLFNYSPRPNTFGGG